LQHVKILQTKKIPGRRKQQLRKKKQPRIQRQPKKRNMSMIMSPKKMQKLAVLRLKDSMPIITLAIH